MIGPLELGDLGSAGVGARSLQRQHDCFRTGVAVAHLLEARDAFAQDLRKLDFEPSRKRKACTVIHRSTNGINDRRMRVPVNQGRKIVDKIDANRAVLVGDMHPGAGLSVKGKWLAPDRKSTNASRQDIERTTVKLRGVGRWIRPFGHARGLRSVLG